MTREEAIDFFKEEKFKNVNSKYRRDWNDASDMAIEALQTDAVEVVRCRECKYRNEYGECDCNSLHMDMEGDTIGVGFVPDKDFYCKYGKRREDGEE